MDWDFRILGDLEIRRDGEPLALGSPRQRALLARLLVSGGEVVSTDRLVDDLWEGEPPDSARHTLHVYVSRLRKALDDGALLERRGLGYRLAFDPNQLDSTRFEQLVGEGRAALARGDAETARKQLEDALRLWRGPALSEFTDEAFAREESVRLGEVRLAALEQRVWADLDLGRHDEVSGELSDLTSKYPFREALWEQSMLAHYRCGRQAEALRVFQQARATLAEELGIEPGPSLRRTEERILAQDPALEATGGAMRGPPRALPLQRTSFVGRETELSEVAELLTRSRLLTLTGAPGSGKTRLALRLAADHVEDYWHGVFFVPLAAVNNPRRVPSTISGVLGLREVPGETPLEGVARFLSERRVLLVLDNFEQVSAAAPQVSALLEAAPDLTIIVTSRMPLGISGEQEYPVPPLQLPPSETLADPGELARCDAIALFVARAKAVDPGFDLALANATIVAEIAARLDGLPLAIELAAARVKLFTTSELLDRLNRRLAVLTGGPADIGDRHRTMRAAVAWSYDLLESDHQTLFERLGVFKGGFTLEAAAAVADLTDDEILDGVETLLRQSLVYRPVDVGPARFAMLETVREYALEKLDDGGEAGAGRSPPDPEVRHRHARYYVTLAEQATEERRGPGLERWSRRFDFEHDNLRAALHWLTENDPDAAVQLAGAMAWYWRHRFLFEEGWDRLAPLVEEPYVAGGAMTARALIGAAMLLPSPSLGSRALGYARRAAELLQDLDEQRLLADCYMAIGSLEGRFDWAQSVADASQAAEQRARDLYEECGDQWGLGNALFQLAFFAASRDEWATALATLQEARACYLEIGDELSAAHAGSQEIRYWAKRGEPIPDRVMAQALRIGESLSRLGRPWDRAFHDYNLGPLYELRGEDDLAIRSLSEAAATMEQVGDREMQYEALGNLGLMLHRMGRAAEAATPIREAARLARDSQYPGAMIWTIECAAAILFDLGHRPEAATLTAWATRIRNEATMRPFGWDEALHADLRRQREGLTPAQEEAATHAAASLTIDDAVNLATDLLGLYGP